MINRAFRLLAIVPLFVAVSTGCSDSPAPTSTTSTSSKEVASSSEGAVTVNANAEEGTVPVVASQGPDGAVRDYLHAIREGNEAGVNQMLTEKARQKTTELNIAIDPPGSETAEFEIFDFEFTNAEKTTAHVSSRWTERNPEIEVQNLDVVWVVRKESQGWRVAGMMAALFPGESPLVFDFENPIEVIRRQEAANAKMAERQKVESEQENLRQARQPSNGETSQPR